jgi:hypothetical protein
MNKYKIVYYTEKDVESKEVMAERFECNGGNVTFYVNEKPVYAFSSYLSVEKQIY